MLQTMPSQATTQNPLEFSVGSLDAEVLIVSEYLSAEELHHKKPLVGSSGYEFKKICNDAGLDMSKTMTTVIAAARPLGGDPRDLFHPTSEKKTNTAFRGLYPKQSVLAGIARVNNLIQLMPNLKLIIGLGSLPLWAFTDKASIATSKGYKIPGGAMKWRGSQLYTTFTSKTIPYLPLVSPTIIMKDWSLRHPTVHDIKARAVRYLQGKPWDRQHSTTFKPNPSFAEVDADLRRWAARLTLGEVQLSVDIETWKRKYIACIGIADKALSLCIPFFYFDKEGKLVDYFTAEQECAIWLQLRAIFSHPNAQIIGQNFIYDNQFLSRQYFINSNLAFDTMLAHHLLWPGTPKSLDYLASLYCDHYVYWKDESQDWDGQFEHESLWLYNCKDVRETYDIAQELKLLLRTLNKEDQWAFQLDQWYLAADMMKRGVNVNRKHLGVINQELTAIAEELETFLLGCMPEDIRFTPAGGPWFSSPKHQMMIFYDMLGLKKVLHKKTKQPTLDITAIVSLKESTPWLSKVFSALETLRSVGVFRSHFLEMKLSFDQRLRCNFNVGGTETFRWSSSANGFGEGTNFQNIPKGDD